MLAKGLVFKRATLGLAAVVVVSVLPFVGLCAYSIVLSPSLTHLVAILNKWQTLIAGGMTLEAAAVGGWFISRQIDATDKQELNRLDRRRAAARAAFPLVLAEINDYTQECCTLILATHDAVITSPGRKPPSLRTPPFPSEVAIYLRELVELGDSDLAIGIGSLLAKAQIQSSRLKWLAREIEDSKSVGITERELFNAIAEASSLCANANQFYPYARGAADRPPVHQASPADILTQCNIMCGPACDIQGLQERVIWWAKLNSHLGQQELIQATAGMSLAGEGEAARNNTIQAEG